jgi:hypothetical protein
LQQKEEYHLKFSKSKHVTYESNSDNIYVCNIRIYVVTWKTWSEGELFIEQERHNAKMQPIRYSMFIKHITEQVGLQVTFQRCIREVFSSFSVGTAATLIVVPRVSCQSLQVNVGTVSRLNYDRFLVNTLNL